MEYYGILYYQTSIFIHLSNIIYQKMALHTEADYARVRPKLELARSLVEPMNNQIKYLVTGGLTEAQAIDADGDNNEDVVVRRNWIEPHTRNAP